MRDSMAAELADLKAELRGRLTRVEEELANQGANLRSLVHRLADVPVLYFPFRTLTASSAGGHGPDPEPAAKVPRNPGPTAVDGSDGAQVGVLEGAQRTDDATEPMPGESGSFVGVSAYVPGCPAPSERCGICDGNGPRA